MSQQNCPLCNGDASFQSTKNPDGKRFTCHHCSEFWIDDYAENHITGIPEIPRSEFQLKFSSHAQKTAPGHLYVIREPKRSEITGDGRGVARTSLISEWVKMA